MNQLRKLYLLIKELGISDLFSYSIYQASLGYGRTRQLTPPGGLQSSLAQSVVSTAPAFCWKSNWDRLAGARPSQLMEDEARLLREGRYRPFYSQPQTLVFNTSSQSDTHWIDVNEERFDDIKTEWEPARFNWSLPLAGAYRYSGDEDLVAFFWNKFSEFHQSNPVNLGPNWTSAQEVAIRAVMWMLAASALRSSPQMNSEPLDLLITSIRQHVERILPTLGYARSQHNNHILSESLCLMLAGDFLADIDPRAERWRRMGEQDFNRAILRQVDASGTYAQHSANYHRMMLQLALLYDARLRKQARQLPQTVRMKLSAASEWLITQLDPASGRLPNLGHNDGTLLLPFGCAEYRDYRPTAQAAAIAFLGQPCLPPGTWDGLASWLELETGGRHLTIDKFSSPAVHKVGSGNAWGTLRAVRFSNRPAHADQLHVELWWHGNNIARDAGTYSYNMPYPWQNALDRTRVHNTITVNETDQMVRVSRFLWLDQAQAKLEGERGERVIQASHNGYRRAGIRHQRSLAYHAGTGFTIVDTLTRRKNGDEIDYCLHWLLPDWAWQLTGQSLILSHRDFSMRIEITGRVTEGNTPLAPVDVSLIRGGESLAGQRQDMILGWESDTYGEKHPALSYSMRFTAAASIELTTKWTVDESTRQ